MPAALVLAYTFVFQFVMKARWGQSADESPLAFGLTLFTGMLVYTLFSESTSRAPGLMLAHPNFVKKVVFPLEILPLTTLLGTLAHLGVSLFVVVTAYALLVQPPGWQALWFPLLLLPYVAFLLGLGWLLSALGVFVRDLGPTVGLIAHVLVFLTPVFYPLGAVPAPWRTLMQLNPLAVFVDNARRVLLWDQPPDWWPLAIASVVGLIVMQLGYALFMRSKRGFAEVV
jgi:lipopolysaccharide transport system permease protein